MNGITGPLDVADAVDIGDMLTRTGRAVPADRWVPELIAARQSRNLRGFE